MSEQDVVRLDRFAKLIVREPGLEPVTVFLTQSEVILGRGEGAHARLHSPFVSRSHVLIRKDAEGHVVCPLDSVNGTTLNGRPIGMGKPTRLTHGDELRVADISIWYVIEIPVDAKTPVLAPQSRTPLTGLHISLDEDRRRVWVAEKGEDVPLAPNEFKLVQHLFNRDGRVATREELLAAVWGENSYDLESLYRLVQRVKEKIEADPANPRYLISHRGLGYSLDIRSFGGQGDE